MSVASQANMVNFSLVDAGEVGVGEAAGKPTRTAAEIDGALVDHRLFAAPDRRPLSGRGLGSVVRLAGPAVIASIAYMDPGNFATNIQAGSRFGYSLLWVVAAASLIAMQFQALSAKLGIVTGKNLAELSRETFSPRVVIAMWVVSELATIATDLAEFVGGALGLSLLTGMPLMAGMGVTAVVTYGLLLLENRGFRPMEIVMAGLVAVIGLSFLAELFIAPVDWIGAGRQLIHPAAPSAEALVIAIGIVGATVMPHTIYLHSGLTQARVIAENESERRDLVRFSNREVVGALSLAGLVNAAMVCLAAAAFHILRPDVITIDSAYRALKPLLGAGAAGIFLISLIASGVSSSTVATMAGQTIMQGFVGFRVPIWLRRLVTMVPSFVVVALGVNATSALVASQVALSFALPVPMIALMVLTGRSEVMGRFANRGLTQALAGASTVVVLALNAVLVAQTLHVPGFAET
jgi:manganese transport protein